MSNTGAAGRSTPQGAQPTTNGSTSPTARNATDAAEHDERRGAIDMQQQDEAALDAEIRNPDAMNVDSSVPAPSSSQTQSASNDLARSMAQPTIGGPRVAAKKDASLREFLKQTDDYAPLIPDAVTDYYLTLAGLPPPPETDRRLARLLALATQKFVADIAADAYQYSRIRSTNTTSNNPLTGLGGAAGFGMSNGPANEEVGGAKGKRDTAKAQAVGGPRAGYGGGGASSGAQGRTVLTMEDLGMAVGEYGVNVKRGEFYR